MDQTWHLNTVPRGEENPFGPGLGYALLYWVVRSICEESRVRSPFVHASTSLPDALLQHMMKERWRGSQPTEGTKMVGINLATLFQLKCFHARSGFLDLSTDFARREYCTVLYFSAGPSGYCSVRHILYVEKNFGNMALNAATTYCRSSCSCGAEMMKEMLLMWRGYIPRATEETAHEQQDEHQGGEWHDSSPGG